MEKEINGKLLTIPQHVAVIMDGNGRWAKKRLMPRSVGHRQGSKIVESIVEAAYDLGIQYFTVYAFSTENWSRPQDEIDELMRIFRSYLKQCIEKSSKNNMKCKVIGDITRFDEDIQERIRELEEVSAKNTGICFIIALNYGGRDEITRAVNRIVADKQNGTLKSQTITDDVITSYLDTNGIPDPELMIRTSGEQRLSNFLLWQLAYSEFYFTDTLWPDFNKKELINAIEYYNRRERRFGGI
ncbi:MAG: isoprenyl transferase [Lachnospiraceae bacterium]